MTRNQRLSSVISILLLTLGVSACLFSLGMAALIDDDQGVLPKSLIAITSTDRESTGRGVMVKNALMLRELEANELKRVVLLRQQAFNVVIPGRDAKAPAIRENLSGLWVDGPLFEHLAWKPLLGRDFLTEDFAAAGASPIIISFRFWQDQLAADPKVLDRTLLVDGAERKIIGVMPPKRVFPFREKIYQAQNFSVVSELQDRICSVIASVPKARISPINQALKQFSEDHPSAALPNGKLPVLRVIGGRELTSNEETQLILMLSNVLAFLLLLLSATNAGSLMLAQWLPRTGELATRSALGSTNARLMAVIVSHSALRVLIAVGLGILIGEWSAPGFAAYMSGQSFGFPEYSELKLSGRSLAWLAGAGIVATLVVSIPMLWKLRESKLLSQLRGSERGNFSANRIGNFLLFTQCSFSVAVVLISLICWRGADIALNREYGVRTDKLLLGSLRSTDKSAQASVAQALLAELKKQPDVEAVSVSNSIPQIATATRDILTSTGEIKASYSEVDSEFATVYGLTLLEGRWLTPEDKNKVVIDLAAAMAAFGKQNVVGKRLSYLDFNNTDVVYARIIGVVAPVTMDAEQGEDRPSIFKPLEWRTQTALHFSIRTPGDPALFKPALQQSLERVDHGMALYNVAPYSERFAEASGGFLLLVGIFLPMGLIASALAGVGLAALLGTLVAQRLRESAIRKSLGARPAQLLTPLLRALAISAVAGVCTGIALVLPLAFRFNAALYGGQSLNVWLVLASALIVFGCLALAAIFPASKALRIEPNVLLKQR